MSAPPCAVDESKGLYPSVQGDPAVASAPGSTAVTYYPSGPPQQQPQQFVVAKPAPVVVQTQQPPQSFVCHILLSCLVVWCCFCPCGFLAFILAMCGYCQASGSPASARRLGIASVVFSVLGILVTVVAAVVVLLVYGAAIIPEITYQFKGCYEIAGHCYRYKTYAPSSTYCDDATYQKYHYAEADFLCYFDN